jgi:hypothetical protein
MILIFILIMILFIAITCAVLIGVSVHDIRAIHRERAIKIHPHAKKWRERPLVSIIIDGTPTEACLASIKNNKYRKKEIITHSSQIPKGDFIIKIHSTVILMPTAILNAVHELNSRQSLQYVELSQHLNNLTNLRQLLNNYQLFAREVFQKSRSGLTISLGNTPQVVMSRRSHTQLSLKNKVWNSLYGTIAILTKIILPFLLMYALYLAFALQQSDALLSVLAIFSVFMTLAIWGHGQLLFVRKLQYFSLLPVSLGFFIVISWITAAQIALRIFGGMFNSLRTSRTSSV